MNSRRSERPSHKDSISVLPRLKFAADRKPTLRPGPAASLFGLHAGLFDDIGPEFVASLDPRRGLGRRRRDDPDILLAETVPEFRCIDRLTNLALQEIDDVVRCSAR